MSRDYGQQEDRILRQIDHDNARERKRVSARTEKTERQHQEYLERDQRTEADRFAIRQREDRREERRAEANARFSQTTRTAVTS